MVQNKKDFLLYGISGTTTKRDCVGSVILFLVFLAPTIFVSMGNIVFCILIPAVYIVGIYKKFDDKGVIKSYNIFLHNGLLAFCLTCTFTIDGLVVLFFLVPEGYYVLAVGIVLICFGMLFMLYVGLTKYLIKKGGYSKANKASGRISFILMGAAGMSTARIFTDVLNNQKALQVLAVCCFFLASLTFLGVFNLYKYYCIKQDESLLRELRKQ